MNLVVIIYCLIFTISGVLTVGNIILKIYNFDKASTVLQPIIIVVTVAW